MSGVQRAVFPLLLLAALVASGILYSRRLPQTQDEYSRVHTDLASLKTRLTAGTNVSVVNRTTSPSIFPQVQMLVPLVHLVPQAGFHGGHDSLLLICQGNDSTWNSYRDSLPRQTAIRWSGRTEDFRLLLVAPPLP